MFYRMEGQVRLADTNVLVHGDRHIVIGKWGNHGMHSSFHEPLDSPLINPAHERDATHTMYSTCAHTHT